MRSCDRLSAQCQLNYIENLIKPKAIKHKLTRPYRLGMFCVIAVNGSTQQVSNDNDHNDNDHNDNSDSNNKNNSQFGSFFPLQIEMYRMSSYGLFEHLFRWFRRIFCAIYGFFSGWTFFHSYLAVIWIAIGSRWQP